MKKLTVVIEGVKLVTGSVAAIGAKKILEYAVEKVVPETLGKSDKFLVIIGTAALGAAVGAAVATSVGQIMDESLTVIESIVTAIKHAQKEEDSQLESLA